MSGKLKAHWDILWEKSEIKDIDIKSRQNAAFLRESLPHLFDLTKAGDCWVWCVADTQPV